MAYSSSSGSRVQDLQKKLQAMNTFVSSLQSNGSTGARASPTVLGYGSSSGLSPSPGLTMRSPAPMFTVNGNGTSPLPQSVTQQSSMQQSPSLSQSPLYQPQQQSPIQHRQLAQPLYQQSVYQTGAVPQSPSTFLPPAQQQQQPQQQPQPLQVQQQQPQLQQQQPQVQQQPLQMQQSQFQLTQPPKRSPIPPITLPQPNPMNPLTHAQLYQLAGASEVLANDQDYASQLQKQISTYVDEELMKTHAVLQQNILKVSMLEAELQKVRIEGDLLAQQLGTAQQEAEEGRLFRQHTEQQVQHMQREFDMVSSTADSAERDRDRLVAEKIQLEQQVRAQKQAYDKLAAQFTDIQSDAERLRAAASEDYVPKSTHARLKKEISEQSAEISAAKRETERFRIRADEATQQMEHVMSELRRSSEELASQKNKNEALNKTLDTLQAERVQSRANVAELLTEIKTLKQLDPTSQLQSLQRAHQGVLEKFLAFEEETKSKIMALEHETQNVRASEERWRNDCAALQSRFRTAMEGFATIQADQKALRMENEDLARSLRLSQDALQQLQIDMKTELEADRTELNKAEMVVRRSYEDTASLGEQLSQLRSAERILRTREGELTQQIRDIRAVADNEQKQRVQLSEDLVAMRAEAVTLRSEAHQWQEQAAKMERSLTSVREENQHMYRASQGQLERYAQDLAALYQETRASNEKMTALQREYDSLKAAIAQQRSESTRESSIAHTQLQSQKDENEDLKTKMRLRQHEVDRLQAVVSRLQQEKHEMEIAALSRKAW